MLNLKNWFQHPGKRACFLLSVVLLAYGSIRILLTTQEQPVNGPHAIRIGSKNFTESLIVAELYAQALEKAHLTVIRKFNLGGTLIANQALQHGEIDVYPEYTGTGLLDVLHVHPPKNNVEALQTLNAAYGQRWHLRWLTPAEANDSQGLVMIRSTSDRLHILTLSQLAVQAPQLRLASIPEFEEREDGLRGLKRAYGPFRFQSVVLFDNGLKYQVLQSGGADVAVCFTTDGALVGDQFRLLEDDRHFWPQYQVAPVARIATLKAQPTLSSILNSVSRRLDTKTLQALNRQVDIEKRDVRQVASQFLDKPGATP